MEGHGTSHRQRQTDGSTAGSCVTATQPLTLAYGDKGPQADTVAIIVAGGKGQRFGDPIGKQFVGLCGLPLMCWPLLAFDHAPSVAHIVIVCAPERRDEVRANVLEPLVLKTPVTLTDAGAERQDSVFSGLLAMPRGYAYVAVHDAARPLIETDTIEGVVAYVRGNEDLAGAICAAPAVDTLKLVDGRTVVATPDRSFYWCAQTPQVFRTRQLVAAYKAADWEGYRGTDDASLVERNGGRVAVFPCTRDNIKVTVPVDLAVVEATLGERLLDDGCRRPEGPGAPRE